MTEQAKAEQRDRPAFGGAGLSEQVYDRCRRAAKLTQRCNDRLERSVSNFAERYVHGDVEIDARIGVKGGNWRAVFRALDFTESFKSSDAAIAAKADAFCNAAYGDESSVFALVVERVKGVKEIVPTLVGLERCNYGLVVGGSLLIFFLDRRSLNPSSVSVIGK